MCREGRVGGGGAGSVRCSPVLPLSRPLPRCLLCWWGPATLRERGDGKNGGTAGKMGPIKSVASHNRVLSHC